MILRKLATNNWVHVSLGLVSGMEGGLSPKREFSLKWKNNVLGALSGPIETLCFVRRVVGGL